jgi:PHD/YefM family antitoxin component YafN of YafNO toxin-antitoxin module
MPRIQPVQTLRDKSTLKKLSEMDEPIYITKNGNPYFVIMNTEKFDEIVREHDHYKHALEREKEIHDISAKIERSRKNVAAYEVMSEVEFEKWLNNNF